MPIAAKVPITVDTTAAMTAMSRVFSIADHNAGDFFEVNMDAYASNVKPLSKLKLELPEKL